MRFEPADGEVPPEPSARPLLPSDPERPILRVDEPGLLDLVVDGGRNMGGRFGMAQTGPVDARAARLANALVGNDPTEPLIELTVRGPSLTALRAVRVAIAGPACVPWIGSQPAETLTTLELAAGDRLSLPHTGQGARSYLAIAGGIESDRFMDSASTDVRGLIGRPLAAGDVLGAARDVLSEMRMSARVDWPVDGATVRILPGPQATPEALERLDGAELRTAAGDRTGVRLEGAKIPGGESVSEPPPLGAVQITPERRPVRPARRPLPHGRLREAGGHAPGRSPDHRPVAARHARALRARRARLALGSRPVAHDRPSGTRRECHLTLLREREQRRPAKWHTPRVPLDPYSASAGSARPAKWHTPRVPLDLLRERGQRTTGQVAHAASAT